MAKFSELVKADSAPVQTWTVEPAILLCPQIPKPMHGLAPRIVLGDEWWQTTRYEAYASTNNHCKACGVHRYRAKHKQQLECHELYETDYLLGRMTYVRTVPLCHFCHAFIHCGRLEALLEKGEIEKSYFDAIMAHGHAILKKAKLKKEQYAGPCADWQDWRLVVNGKEYKPLHKSYEEWEKFYGSLGIDE